jgi:hypothetical protein
MNILNNKENISTSTSNSPRKQQVNSSKCETESTNLSDDQASFKFSSKPSLENIRSDLEQFCKERNWEKYHTPRNLLLGII